MGVTFVIQNDHLNEIKQSLEIKKTEQVQKLENKLTAAEQKREEEILKKLENIKKHVSFINKSANFWF